MQPTPSPYKKFLLPGLAIVALVIVGLLLFLKGGAVDQGASLLTGITKTSSLRAVPPIASSCRPTIGANGVPVAPTPSVKVISPNGGETYQAGQQITVTWSTCNIPANAKITINLHDTISGNAQTLSQNFMPWPNTGSALITLPNPSTWQNALPMVFGNRYKIKIEMADSYALTTTPDFSDNLFTINGPIARVCKPTDPLSIRVESPNGGETFTAGQQILVRWSTCSGRSDDIARITLTTSFGQGASAVIATVHEQPGYSMVTLPSSIGSVPVVAGNYYKIEVDYLDNVPGGSLFATDTSNGFFRIQ